MDDWPDDAQVRSFGQRMRCSRCGKPGATAEPNWIERAARLPRCSLRSFCRAQADALPAWLPSQERQRCGRRYLPSAASSKRAGSRSSNSHFGLWSGFGAGSLTGQSQTKSLLGGSGAEAVGVCPSNSRAGPMIREFGRTNSHGALRHEETRHVGERPWPERPNLMEDAVAALRRPGSQADPARCRRLSNS
jgi:hypothetical protein